MKNVHYTLYFLLCFLPKLYSRRFLYQNRRKTKVKHREKCKKDVICLFYCDWTLKVFGGHKKENRRIKKMKIVISFDKCNFFKTKKGDSDRVLRWSPYRNFLMQIGNNWMKSKVFLSETWPGGNGGIGTTFHDPVQFSEQVRCPPYARVWYSSHINPSEVFGKK